MLGDGLMNVRSLFQKVTMRGGTKTAATIIIWRCGVVVITTAQLHSTKPEIRFCAGSNPARSASEIRDGEDL